MKEAMFEGGFTGVSMTKVTFTCRRFLKNKTQR